MSAINNSEAIGTALRRILAMQLGLPEHAFRAEQLLDDDLGIDSLDAVEIVMDIEETFGIDVTDEEFEAAKSIGELAALIESKVL